MSLVQFTTQQTYPSSLLHIILMFFYGISAARFALLSH